MRHIDRVPRNGSTYFPDGPTASIYELGIIDMWTDFFVAAASASAALAGLVIVAISVNVNRILEHADLPPRAGAAISALILILVSRAALIHQPLAILGIEILFFALCCWLLEASFGTKVDCIAAAAV
jgi:hypothetical protein